MGLSTNLQRLDLRSTLFTGLRPCPPPITSSFIKGSSILKRQILTIRSQVSTVSLEASVKERRDDIESLLFSTQRKTGASRISSGVKLENIRKSYKGVTVLKDVSWEVKRGEKVGLVGVNGSGKTTQLRIITGQEEPDSGNVIKAKPDMKVAFLSQEFDVSMSRTVKEEFMSAFKEEIEITDELDIVNKDEFDLLQRQAQAVKLDNVTARVSEMMTALGFEPEDEDRLVDSFSGGWQMRMSLGKVLLQDPDLLLLDEPTNHVDLDTIEWLEGYLQEKEVPMVLISHDRAFLDQLCTKIVEIEMGVSRTFEGNYSHYVLSKAIWIETQRMALKSIKEIKDLLISSLGRASNAAKKLWELQHEDMEEIYQYLKASHGRLSTARKMQDEEMEETKDLIARLGHASTAAKKLEELLQKPYQRKDQQVEMEATKDLITSLGHASAEAKELGELQDELIENPYKRKQRQIRFPERGRSGRSVVTVKDVEFGFVEDKMVFKKANLAIERGEKIVIIGANGCGKSTLLKLIMGLEKPMKGQITLRDYNVLPNYFEQNQAEVLDMDKTVLETVVEAAQNWRSDDIKCLLGRCNFKADMLDQKVSLLSGGEKARLAFCNFIVTPSTLLVLDEPTNHLDIPSKEMLEEAINEYQGTVIAVSHDRYFIKQIVDRVIEVKDGCLQDYTGDYDYYLYKNLEAREMELEREAELKEKAPKPKAKKWMSDAEIIARLKLKLQPLQRQAQQKSIARYMSNAEKEAMKKQKMHWFSVAKDRIVRKLMSGVEKETRKKQKMQSFTFAKNRSKATKNSKRWN